LDGTEITTLRGHTAAIRQIAISRDGKILASGGDDNTLILWNLSRILKLDALTYGCKLVQDYLKTNTAVEKGETPAESRSDRSLCNHSQNQGQRERISPEKKSLSSTPLD
ncbi:MAG: hypothetical protein ICV54_02810, partial [Nostoc sp. C3-bin3]|nr:hypothetical protein [Nostoc sp. C3-bin3]